MDLSEVNRRGKFSGSGDVVVNGSRRNVSAKRNRVTRSIVGVDVDADSPECFIETKFFSKNSVSKRKLAGDVVRFPVKERRITRSEMKARRDSGMNVDEKGGSHTVVDKGKKPKRGGEEKLKSPLKQPSDMFPSTVKDLLSTGLLEGLPVVYNGGKKGTKIHGIIKESGILCSCKECKGCRVILTTQFEIHACKVKRHATQYIFLENGKNLREILEICKIKSNGTLEAIIRNAIGSFFKNPSSFDSSENVSIHPPLAKTKPDGYDSSLGDSRARPNIFICYSRTRPNVVGCSHSKSEAKPQMSEQPLCDSTTNSKELSIKSIEKKMPLCDSTTNSKEPTIKNIENKRKREGLRKSSKLPKSSTYMLPKSSTYKLAKSSISSKLPKSSTYKLAKSSISSKLPKSSISKPPKSSTSKMPKSSISKPPKSLTSKMPKSSTSKRSSNYLAIVSSKSKNEWKITKKDNRLHKLVFEGNVLPDGSELAYYKCGKKLLEGYKKGYGIFCCCCSSVVSPSVFESHAGCATLRKPYHFIYTSNGVSLHELAVSLLKGLKFASKESDELCMICSDGGNLLICDGCPRVFHKECASLKKIPVGDWYCHYCENNFQLEKSLARNANAVAAGRMSGVDPIEQITRRSIRIVQNVEFEVSACALCRDYDFSNSGFGSRTVILCDQCQKGFHVGCLREHKMHILKELPKGEWFCNINCESIYYIVQKLLADGSKKVPNAIVNALRKKHRENDLDSKNIEVRWQLLNGKIATPETKLLLAKAISIFHACFDPIVDYTTGKDLIPSMVYGRNTKVQEYVGMHCVILMVNSVVVSTGILRIFNSEIAELPLIATAKDSQGKGYFQALLSCIERMLVSINVRNFIIPAVGEAESKWTEKFGFQKMRAEKFADYEKRYCQMTVFEGTSMLAKRLTNSG